MKKVDIYDLSNEPAKRFMSTSFMEYCMYE